MRHKHISWAQHGEPTCWHRSTHFCLLPLINWFSVWASPSRKTFELNPKMHFSPVASVPHAQSMFQPPSTVLKPALHGWFDPSQKFEGDRTPAIGVLFGSVRLNIAGFKSFQFFLPYSSRKHRPCSVRRSPCPGWWPIRARPGR